MCGYHDSSKDSSSPQTTSSSPKRPLRVGTGRVFPTKFLPNPGSTPKSLFHPRLLGGSSFRFIHVTRKKNKQFLIYTDGACSDNGYANARAGCSVVLNHKEHLSFRLENRGPTNKPGRQASNRAELRAAIAAIRYKDWESEGCHCLVIATDSRYVVEGITTWAKNWTRNGWRNANRLPVMNQDLWKTLLGEVETSRDEGMNIQFWRIPRKWNKRADRFAKEAVNEDEVWEFSDNSY